MAGSPEAVTGSYNYDGLKSNQDVRLITLSGVQTTTVLLWVLTMSLSTRGRISGYDSKSARMTAIRSKDAEFL